MYNYIFIKIIMTKNQLFRKVPSKELVLKVVKSFGLTDFDDIQKFSKKKLMMIGTVGKINDLKLELEKYYLPCKSRTYLNDLNEKNVITVLRQCIRIYGYTVISKERYLKGEKFIMYKLHENKKKDELSNDDKPHNIEKTVKQIIINFD